MGFFWIFFSAPPRSTGGKQIVRELWWGEGAGMLGGWSMRKEIGTPVGWGIGIDGGDYEARIVVGRRVK
jgi:hypothetical protein